MTAEELFKTRYKVIADYPRQKFEIGDIIIPNREDGVINSQWVTYKNDGSYLFDWVENIDKYPHLFKKLEWWEERGKKEMPEYLQCIYTGFIKFVKGQIITVEKHQSNTFNQNIPWLFISKEKQNEEGANCLPYKYFIPAMLYKNQYLPKGNLFAR